MYLKDVIVPVVVVIALLGWYVGICSGENASNQTDTESSKHAEGPEKDRYEMRESMREQLKQKIEKDITGSTKRGIIVRENQKKMAESKKRWIQQSFEQLKQVIGASDQEWTIIRPRLEKVYYFYQPSMLAEGGDHIQEDIKKKTENLSKLLLDADANTEQIKAKLDDLRAAKRKAKQELMQAQEAVRQVLTVRQESQLVIRGVLE